MRIQFKKLHPQVELPKYATEGSAGFDLVAMSFQKFYDPNAPVFDSTELLIPDPEQRIIQLIPGARILIGAGFSVAIPEGYELQVRPRSGLALKKGITVVNSPGTIDSDYRGEVGVILLNTSKHIVSIGLGEKIAQCVLAKHEVAVFEVVEELSNTERGEGGFGHTDHKPASL